ncbi:MAG: choice-of-anchor U domain-containing protein [Verrucomicrobiia bacterium]
MKTRTQVLTIISALLFGLLPAHAQSLYVHKELFLEGPSTSGTRTLAGLNNRGEVLYLYSSTNVTDGSAIPALWLPKPNYGLPAGFTRLTNFPAVTRSPLPWFTDDGTFYTLVTDAKQGNLVYRGSAAGESLLCSQVSNAVTDFFFRDQVFAVTRSYIIRGITTQGEPFGDVEDNYPEIYSRLRGVFVGFPPGAPITSISMPIGPPGTPTTLASSPNGTVVVHLTGVQYLNFDNPDVPYGVLGVVHSGSSRRIPSTLDLTGRTYPYVTSDPLLFAYPFTVNDVGDAAGIDDTMGSLWFSPHTGGMIRAGRTNVSSVLLDKASTVWFVSNFYQDIWHGDQQDFSPASSNRLHLPWTTWGYTNVPTLAFVNDRGQLLVHAQKTNSQVWAVLLSPRLTVALSVSTNHLSVGDSLTVTGTITALGDQPLTGISPTGPLDWNGKGAFELLSGPTPAPPWSLQPGEQMQAQWQCQATTNGIGRFGLAIQAPPLLSLSASSEPVRVVPHGDLLIRRVIAPPDPPDSYTGGGIYQTLPRDPQIKTNTVPPNQDSEFQVQIQNTNQQPHTYTLAVVERGEPGWRLTCQLGGQDVTTQLLVPGGAILPTLAAASAMTLDVTMRATNAPSGDIHRVDFRLALADEPQFTLDAVEAATEVTNNIVVNSTGDLPDLDPEDCCCDTGRKLKDGVTPECTLRAAIEFANRYPGKDTIKFKIPKDDAHYNGGTPLIQPQTPLPDITGPVILDGWSQNTGATTPPIELSGKDLPRYCYWRSEGFLQDIKEEYKASGFVLVAGKSQVRGFVFNHFPYAALDLRGGGNIVQGNFVGTDATGTISKGNGYAVYSSPGGGWLQSEGQIRVASAGNQIGGIGPRAGNVISTGAGWIETFDVMPRKTHSYYGTYANPLGIFIRGSDNVVEGNIIGLQPNGVSRFRGLPYGPNVHSSGPDTKVKGSYGIGIMGGNNRIGGLVPGARNVISEHLVGIGILLSPDLLTSQVLGNLIGTDISGTMSFPNLVGIRIFPIVVPSQEIYIGGMNRMARNVISGNGIGVYVRGQAPAVVLGNYIGVQIDGVTPLPNGIGVFLSPEANIGAGGVQVLTNIIAFNARCGVMIGGQQRNHNRQDPLFGWVVDELGPPDNSDRNLISGNAIYRNGNGHDVFGMLLSSDGIGGIAQVLEGYQDNMEGYGAGIYMIGGSSNRITANSIFGNRGLGIDLGGEGRPVLNDFEDVDTGPNQRQNFPRINQVSLQPGTVTIAGMLMAESAIKLYRLEFFASHAANASGYGEGRRYLGTTDVMMNPGGLEPFSVTLPYSPDLGLFLAATATAILDRNTSEFSPAAVVIVESRVPSLKGSSQVVRSTRQMTGSDSVSPETALRRRGKLSGGGGASATGDGNGDGLPDEAQDNVTSLVSLPGVWVTLAAPDRVVLESVLPQGTADLGKPPWGYTFPLGFLSLAITNLPPAGAVAVTNFLHLDAAADFAYAATTYFNYGPTPDNPIPHWYEFDFDGATGAELLPDRILLHFRDGARGDDDLVVNGGIATLGGPASPIPRAPPLALVRAEAGFGVDMSGGTNSASGFGTNLVPVVDAVLAWPETGTNYMLQSTDRLLPVTLSYLTNQFILPVQWCPCPETPAIVNGQNVVTNTTGDEARFYRLMESSLSASGLTAEDLVQGTYSWTGNAAWSDPANWNSTSLPGGAPLTNGLQLIDVVFPAGGSPITSVVDGSYAVRSLSIPAGAPSVDLQSGGPALERKPSRTASRSNWQDR